MAKKLHKQRKTKYFFVVNPVGGGALYPTIPRMNHSCSPNAVWSWKKGNTKRKDVRAIRKSVSKDLNRLNSLEFLRISEGDEICSNYIDDVETNYNTTKTRQVSKNDNIYKLKFNSILKASLQRWNFLCACPVCSLPVDKLL